MNKIFKPKCRICNEESIIIEFPDDEYKYWLGVIRPTTKGDKKIDIIDREYICEECKNIKSNAQAGG